MHRLPLAGLLSLMIVSTTFGGDVAWIEDFSLAKDRAVALKALIPGTEDYYYYHALQYLNTEQFDKAKELFGPWHERFNQSARLTEIQTRHALLTYERDPKQTLEYLRNRIRVQFNHQKEISDGPPNLPTKFDNAAISRATLLAHSMAHWQHLDNFEDAALDWLAAENLNADRRRTLLARLKRPDFTNLVTLVADDLKAPNSGGFGSFPVHAMMTLTQLEALLKLMPNLKDQQNFVHAWLRKLHPGADDDWKRDSAKTLAFLDRLLAYVRTLAPVHNSLKAHVLYHKLAFDRSKGLFNKELFLEYLALPRPTHYWSKAQAESDAARRFPVDLNHEYSPLTLMPPVRNDEPIVRSYLQHFFVNADGYQEFVPFINETYLKHLYAETKIENGLGEPEKWASELPPEMYAALKNRIDIDFDATNKVHFTTDEAVTLNLHVKNVPTLIVKVFEINTFNYYKEMKKEIDTDVNLDGLVANSEQTFNYAEPALRKLPRQFAFPQLTKPGVYVVDFIGGGKSSRALIRKGRMRPLVTTGTAGQVVTVIDENNAVVKDATLWFGGKDYMPDKSGTTLLPFSTAPGPQPIVIRRGDFASLDTINHQPEAYRLVAGIHVDREALLSQRLASIVVRPGIYLNGQPVSTKLLEDVKLRITSLDLDGIPVSQEIPDFKLFEDRESVHEFRVPPRMVTLNVTLMAKVTSLTTGQKVDVLDSHAVTLNGIYRTDHIEDLHFAKFGNDYVLEMLGRSGESKQDRPVSLSIKHRDFKQPVQVTLKTDPAGRVMLGELKDIVSVSAHGPNGQPHVWWLPTDHFTYRAVMHAKAGDVVRVPYMGILREPSRLEFALFEMTAMTIKADKFEAISLKDGFVELTGLAAGDFELVLKASNETIRIRVVEGSVQDGYVLGKLRLLELPKILPPSISALTTEGDSVTIKLKDATSFARVHVIASRYQPAFSAFNDLARVRASELGGVYPASADSVYLTGRAIGDEYRYVLDRRYAKKYPGNMLERPQLLLNPWAIRETKTGEQLAEAGGEFGGVGGAKPASRPEGLIREGGGNAGDATGYPELDFLADGSTLLANLVADKDGVISFKKILLGSHGMITIAVVDPLSTTVKTITLPEQKAEILDLRLRNGLDPKGHFTQQKQVTLLEKAKPFVMNDAASGRFEAYDTLGKVFSLYGTLLKDARFAEFAFLTQWPTLKPEQKKAEYSKHACHELSFFLMKKDPEFFKTIIKPYLANKKDKTFLDQWLLDADVAEYASPWKHNRLNTAERVLLSQRLPGEPAKTARHIQDLLKLQPVNLEQQVFLFDASVSNSALETATTGLAALQAVEMDKLRMDPKAAGNLGGGGFGGAPAPAVVSPPPAPPGAAAAGRPRNEPMAEKSEAMKEMKKATEELRAATRDGASRRKMDAAREKLDQAGKAGPAGGDFLAGNDEGNGKFFGDDRAKRQSDMQRLFRKVEQTMEYAEQNYYKRPIAEQLAELVPISAFWAEYATHDAKTPFLSKHLPGAARNLNEALLALAVTDLPFDAPKPDVKFDAGKMTYTATGPGLAFHEEVRGVAAPAGNGGILVNQNFYKDGDRFRDENGERTDKFVTAEFVINTVYGCQIVVTNPSPSRQKLAVLLQIPVGSLPLKGGRNTRTVLLNLEPYHTQTIDYFFYFPKSGQFNHYPVQVAKNEVLVAAATPFAFNVVDKPTKLDTESWDYVSQNGTNEQVLAYLERENISALNLEKIAFRMRDDKFFKTVLTLLQSRHVYHSTLWSYSLLHNDVAAARVYLQYADTIAHDCGGPLTSTLVTYNPVERYEYQHLEYKPLVNARAHALGQRRQIVNGIFLDQYHHYLKLLSYRSKLTDADKLAVVYYLLLQDRVEESLAWFATVDAKKVPTQMQYDYCAAYLAMSESDPKRARGIAEKYATHPVDKWKNTFAAVVAQVDEIEGKGPKVIDPLDRQAQQTAEAAKEPSFDFTLENKAMNLTWQNVSEVTVNYYLMDVELLFSRNPFVQQTGNQFAMIKPNATKVVKLDAAKKAEAFALPEEFVKRNVLVEVVAAGKSRSHPYYANAMDVKVTEGFGQVKVTNLADGKALGKVYVKAYIRTADGQVKFHKDGYTDLRGRFDYASVSTPEKSPPVRYSVLILSDEFGAVIREAAPPQQ
ncbi:hypothetical protein BH11PLA2_BH11PLA2_15090 [soil metagenome]